MIKINEKNFNLKQIAISGQCFRMDEIESGKFLIISADKVVKAEQEPIANDVKGESALAKFNCTKREWNKYWSHYFDIETDYKKIIESINPRDKYLTKAAHVASGVRILNQDLWEMLLSYLISQQNNIPRIKKSIKALSEKYGKEIEDGIFAVPTPEALASLFEDALMSEGLGYRSKYVVRTARQVAEGTFDLEALRKLSYEEAREKLLSLYGVGVKVADCVCLFGLHHVEAFPIDTHIKQILKAHYKKGFPHKRYEGYAGILQQYMFYYDLNG